MIFLFFLLASSIFWLLQALNKEYVAKITYPVQYSGFPKGKVLTNKLPDHLILKVKAHGFTLLGYKINPAIEPITISVNTYISDSKSTAEGMQFPILTKDFKGRIIRQISSEIELVDILPDTIRFHFTDIISKNVFVKPDIKSSFEKQYKQKGKYQIKPYQITAKGPRAVLDTIDFAVTEFRELTNLNKTTVIDLALKKIKGVSLSPETITLTVPVEKFTEGSMIIPIEVKNLPDSLQLSTFPGEITVSYLIGLEDYDKVESSDFRAIVDYKSINNNLGNKLRVKIVKHPSNASSIKFHPKSVEYIVEK